MNNIEILEELKARLKLYKKSTDVQFTFTKSDIQAIENLIQENKELKEYKKIAELTKISCCTAQNCEALNNAIKNGLENEKLLQENKELKEKIEEYEKQLDLDYVEENYIPKSKIEKALDKMNERYMTPEAISNSNGATFNYWTGKRDMCIELLEKGE